MTELTISADEIRSAIEGYVSTYTPEASREEVGVVSETYDGIAIVEGLPSAMTNELLRFPDGTLGVALNLDAREIGIVVQDASKSRKVSR
jgi:F-type H+-transporting ATPase subunit alpha